MLAQAMRDDLSYASDVSGVLLSRDAGAAVVASYTVQECFNMALISHIVAHRARTPVIHTFDGDLVARASAVVDRLEFDNTFLDQLCQATQNPSGGVPTAFTSVFDELAPVLGKRYVLPSPSPHYPLNPSKQTSPSRLLALYFFVCSDWALSRLSNRFIV